MRNFIAIVLIAFLTMPISTFAFAFPSSVYDEEAAKKCKENNGRVISDPNITSSGEPSCFSEKDMECRDGKQDGGHGWYFDEATGTCKFTDGR